MDIAGYMKTKCLEEYDRYKGITELMPYAKGVHAKSHLFTADGNDQETDFNRMFKIIKTSGFTGWISVEYEGGLFKMYTKDSKYLDDYAGTTATKNWWNAPAAWHNNAPPGPPETHRQDRRTKQNHANNKITDRV
jgi:hypothetical protein